MLNDSSLGSHKEFLLRGKSFCIVFSVNSLMLFLHNVSSFASYEDIVTAWKYPDTEFFLIRIFSYSDWIRIVTPYLSVFSPNAWKYGPEKTSYLDTFSELF